MRRLSVILAVLLLTSVAKAGSDAPSVVISPAETVVSAQTLASARNSSCMLVRGAHYLVLDLALTRGGSATQVETKCFAHRTSTCADSLAKRILECTNGTCKQHKPTYKGEDGAGISANDAWSHRFDVAGFAYAQCTHTSSPQNASDVLTVTAYKTQE